MIGRASSSASFLSIAHSSGLCFSRIALARLPLNQPIDLGVAVAVPVQVRTAAIEYIENPVGIGPAGLQAEAERELLVADPGGLLGSQHKCTDLRQDKLFGAYAWGCGRVGLADAPIVNHALRHRPRTPTPRPRE